VRPSFRLRKAGPQDCRRLWQWRNEPGVRKASFNSRPIPFSEHCFWYAKILKSPATRLFIGEAGGQAVGQVRINLLGYHLAEVHIHVKKNLRGRGFGAQLLAAGCRYTFRYLRVKRILAHIRPSNKASLKLFHACGFRFAANTRLKGQPAQKLVLRKRSSKA
jgi:RimJ/RimL family protein N-acetyltransferase